MKIVEIDNYRDFLALEDQWNDVLRRSKHTIFSSWEWLSTWWKHFGTDKRLIILLAEENNKILGIAPLMYSVHTMFGLRLRKIEFIGAETTDYNNFIISEKSKECINLFIQHLHGIPEKWDVIDLVDIPENAECLSPLSEISKELKPFHTCSYLPIPNSYEKFLSYMKSNQRSYLRRNIKKLEKNFDVEFLDCSGVDSFVDGMNSLFDLHQKRWMSRGECGAFAEQQFRSFNLDIAKTFSQKQWLGLYLLKLSGNIVAADYGFNYNSTYCSYLTGFDPRYYKFSVGNMLRVYMIQHFIQNGIVEYDLLRGAEQYKHRWRAIDRVNSQAIIIKDGVLSKMRDWLYTEYWRQGSRLKYFLKMN